MYKWYLPTLSEVIALSEPMQEREYQSPAQSHVRAEKEWSGAIAALNSLLQQTVQSKPQTATDGIQDCTQTDIDPAIQGLVLSGPAPVLDQCELVQALSAWTFTVGPVGKNIWMPLQLLPAAEDSTVVSGSEVPTLPLMPNDPLAAEQFCLVLTADFSLVMALGEGSGETSSFLFSFNPEVVWQAWRSLQSRLLMTRSPSLNYLETLVKTFPPVAPHYQTVMQFSRLILANLPDPYDWETKRDANAVPTREAIVAPPTESETEPSSAPPMRVANWQQAVAERKADRVKTKTGKPGQDRLDKLTQVKPGSDTELLQAIAHEVRTPLTTIRTLTRLLLKRKDLNPDVIKRLEVIDHECTEQINRFNLIFRAVELETSAVKSSLMSLAPISLAQVFQQNVPRWQQQASQHNLTLEVLLPQKLPMVVADPTMLDQVLTGLIDRITHSLPPGSQIRLHVSLAGHQLKLQFQSHPQCSNAEADAAKGKGETRASFTPTLKSIGQLLMFQPETGNLSLNLSVTKNLFQALGGKLIVRQKPEQGEVLTIFLPLETRTLEA